MGSLINTSNALRETVSTDFGKVFYAKPKGYTSPTNKISLTNVVKECYLSKTPIIPRGMSHSASGQCLSPNGVVIDMKQMNKIHDLEFDGEKGFIMVDAGITWEKVIKACLEHNATPEILTDWQKLTVGGTISTGGLGFMSHLHGIQADTVYKLEVVTGKGELVECSPLKNKDLFNLVRGGLGQYGIIATAWIQLKKAPKVMHVHKTLISSTSEFSLLMDKIRGKEMFECIHSFLIPHETNEFIKKFGQEFYLLNKNKFDNLSKENAFSYFVEVVQYEYENQQFSKKELVNNQFSCYEQVDFYEYVTKEPPLITTQKEKGSTAHPELAVFIPVTAFDSFMNYFLKNHNSKDMGEGPVLIMPILSKAIKESAFVPLKEDFYFIGILRNAFPNTKENIANLTSINERIYSQSLSLNGKRYPCDSLRFPETKQEWKEHFGKKWNFVESGKLKYDPEHIFKSLLTLHKTP